MHFESMEKRLLMDAQPGILADIRVDTNRDGVINKLDNAHEADWTSGKNGSGAIILPNLDRDNTTTGAPDNWVGGVFNNKTVAPNNVIDNAADLLDIGRLLDRLAAERVDDACGSLGLRPDEGQQLRARIGLRVDPVADVRAVEARHEVLRGGQAQALGDLAVRLAGGGRRESQARDPGDALWTRIPGILQPSVRGLGAGRTVALGALLSAASVPDVRLALDPQAVSRVIELPVQAQALRFAERYTYRIRHRGRVAPLVYPHARNFTATGAWGWLADAAEPSLARLHDFEERYKEEREDEKKSG